MKKSKPEPASQMHLEPWMLETAYNVASILPADPDQASAILVLAKQMVMEINEPFVKFLRRRDTVRRKG